MPHRLLIINPGSTSTKIAVYDDEYLVLSETIRHSPEELQKGGDISAQLPFRKELILKVLTEKRISLSELSAIVARGGLLKPLASGVYRVGTRMFAELKSMHQGQHASNLAGIIAYELAHDFAIPAYIVDPPVVDEMDAVARISGMPEIERKSAFHALNQKAVARKYAQEKRLRYEELSLIIAHLGGGISVGAHNKGRVIDVNNALDGEGPFSPERSGSVPVGDLIRLCYSGKYSLPEMLEKVSGRGGMVAYVGTNDVNEIASKSAAGDERAKLLLDAFSYQVAKEIAGCAAALRGAVDAIILTGGIAYSPQVTRAIRDRVEFIAPVMVYPGEDEMLALAQGGLRVLRGEEEAKEYS